METKDKFEDRHFEIRSDAIKEMSSSSPGFLIKYGIYICFGLLVCLFVASYFIKFTTKSTGYAKVLNGSPGGEIRFKNKGKIAKIFYLDQDSVTVGSVIGYLENSAAFQDVIYIANVLDSMLTKGKEGNDIKILMNYWNSQSRRFLKLGELATAHRYFLEAIEKERNRQNNYKTFSTDISWFLNEIEIYYNIVQEWKSKNLILANKSGKINFYHYLSEGYEISQGENIGFISERKDTFYAELFIPRTNLDKASIGKVISINLNYYPKDIYGSLKGIIQEVKGTELDSGYIAKVTFPDGLVTDKNVKIKYFAGLSGLAEISISKHRLLEKLTSSLHPFKKN